MVLPSSFVGSPRYMNQCFQDAMALARYYHGFNLFITFTCNPSWKEFQDTLLYNQSTIDRPDLALRVFHMYITSFLDDLMSFNIFGPLLGQVYTIEFQKRGLPHMHLLLTLSPTFCLETLEQVDMLIRATWPDPHLEPSLFDVVKRCMVHGPCDQLNKNAPCMKDGRCSKGFPKAFQSETVMSFHISIDNISFLGRASITPASKSRTSLSFFFLFTICNPRCEHVRDIVSGDPSSCTTRRWCLHPNRKEEKIKDSIKTHFLLRLPVFISIRFLLVDFIFKLQSINHFFRSFTPHFHTTTPLKIQQLP